MLPYSPADRELLLTRFRENAMGLDYRYLNPALLIDHPETLYDAGTAMAHSLGFAGVPSLLACNTEGEPLMLATCLFLHKASIAMDYCKLDTSKVVPTLDGPNPAGERVLVVTPELSLNLVNAIRRRGGQLLGVLTLIGHDRDARALSSIGLNVPYRPLFQARDIAQIRLTA